MAIKPERFAVWPFIENPRRKPHSDCFFKICLVASHGACLFSSQQCGFYLCFHSWPVSCLAELGEESDCAHACLRLSLDFPVEWGTAMLQLQPWRRTVNRNLKPEDSQLLGARWRCRSRNRVTWLGYCLKISFGSSSHSSALLTPFCTCPDKTLSVGFYLFIRFYEIWLYIRLTRRNN